MINWLRGLFTRRRVLLCMRLADMHVSHPLQIIERCNTCGHDIAVYPSGQEVMRRYRNVELLCQVCRLPGENAKLAPGVLEEVSELRRRR